MKVRLLHWGSHTADPSPLSPLYLRPVGEAGHSVEGNTEHNDLNLIVKTLEVITTVYNIEN